ncbi:sigma-70 family RNA polymerase sigma factor [Actinocrinis sp.]|uniref:RNA polymerase sigma factor n=1 Tax=Actinocrinis sp. TaxID=1920516 RepID=UPI002D220F82|nr:sigma-70 family RNA polymerase sigma factor [Actinocrinis sp.]HZP50997.1 sigma-70 family RNA polymerase sigma factor [Actinocrinis sp.]
MQDRDLVAAIVAGDPAGLAAAYDRYASALYTYCRSMLRDAEDAADALQDTFVVAAQKLDGLRDPDRLRPWLYAVARNECLRRLRGRQGMVELDQAGEVSDDAVDVDAGLREADVRGLIWAAIQGLNPSEREVFELNVRHELEGADLAAALGVSANHAHALLSRARGQLEKSLGALLVARTGRAECAELAAILDGWDGELTALLRKRINRHIEQCEICGERKRYELRPEMLLGAMPLLLLPPGLRANVMRMVGDAMPGSGNTGNTSNSGNSGNSRNSGGSGDSGGSGGSGSSTGGSGNFGNIANGALGGAAAANLAEYCARVAKRAEPFNRDGFPVPLDRRRKPLAAARRKTLVAAAVLLVLLLGIGGYTTLRYLSPGNTAAAIPTHEPSVVAVVDTGDGSSLLVEISTSAASPSASPSQSPSASASPSASPSVIVVRTSARPSRSPSRSPSPSPPPPPPGVLVANPTFVLAPFSGNAYQGTFKLIARGGPVSGYTIIVPPPPPSNTSPSAFPTTGGPMVSGQSDTITVYIDFTQVVFTVEPKGTQAPILVTVSPSFQIIP